MTICAAAIGQFDPATEEGSFFLRLPYAWGTLHTHSGQKSKGSKNAVPKKNRSKKIFSGQGSGGEV